MKPRLSEVALVIFFSFSVVFHLLALVWPRISVPESVTEHVVFAVINTLLVLLTIKRWKFPLVLCLSLLFVEQVAEHVPMLITSIQRGGFDVQSLAAVAGVALAIRLATLESP